MKNSGQGSNPLKKTLQELSAALRDLHRDLLLLEAKVMEEALGRKLSPYDLLNASLRDPKLNWLRQISILIVSIDTTIDEATNLSGKEANQIASEVLALLERPPGDTESEFWSKYSSYLSNAEIIMKHSRVKTLLGLLRPRM